MSRLVVFYLFNSEDVWICTWQSNSSLELESLTNGHRYFMTHEALADKLAESKVDITANAAIAILQASAIIDHGSRGPGTQLVKR